jgi:hypothetical protein
MSDHGHDAHDPALRPDTTPPRDQLILVIVLATVSTLFALKFGFDSYLDREVRVTRTHHLADSTAAEALAAYHAEADSALAGGAMTIDEAIEQLGSRGRAAFVQIRPAPGDPSRAAMEGWATLPVAAGEAPPTPSRTPYVLSVDHMPPPDPEVEAIEAAMDAPPAPPAEPPL